MINRRQFIKGILALAVIPQIPFVGVEEIIDPYKLRYLTATEIINMWGLKVEYARESVSELSKTLDKILTKSMNKLDDQWIPTGRTA